jgi:hypothetical protein
VLSWHCFSYWQSQRRGVISFSGQRGDRFVVSGALRRSNSHFHDLVSRIVKVSYQIQRDITRSGRHAVKFVL